MARLTRYAASGVADVSAKTYREKATNDAISRLAAYEDTGLEPEEIYEVQEAMGPILFARFREIMEAEQDGRLRVEILPMTARRQRPLKEKPPRKAASLTVLHLPRNRLP